MPFTLIIPAHNEEAVIARCLNTALSDAPANAEIEVIVAANGCTDKTVEIARATAPDAIVLDLAEGSKTAAINAANSAASHFPRIYLDADIECSYSSLAALAEALREPGVMTVAPAIRLELSHCNWLVRSYYAAWAKQPYARSGKGGAGCYGLSQAALEQVGAFPPIIGDDIWIHTRFPDEVKRLVETNESGEPVFSIVRPPSTLRQQIAVEVRRMLGNAEVRQDYPSPYLGLVAKGGGLLGSIRSGANPLDLAVFLFTKAMVRLGMRRSKARGRSTEWTRDLSSREV